MDLGGMSMWKFKQVRNVILSLTKTDQDNYPEYLNQLHIVNAPAAFLDDRWGHNRTRCPAVPLDSPLFPRRADLQVSQSNQPGSQ